MRKIGKRTFGVIVACSVIICAMPIVSYGKGTNIEEKNI